MRSIREVIQELVSRGNLPESVVMRCRLGSALPGDVATWDDSLGGYRLDRDPEWIILAGKVRELWGEYFLEHHEVTQTCLAL